MGERYETVKKLSEGGSGTVFLVWDTHLEKHRVMKEILFFREGQEQAALQEIHVLKQMQREGIPRLLDVVRKEKGICLIMEYMEGISLADKVERDGSMPEKEAVVCMLQLGELLLFLHRQRPPVLHGDIKPGNVILGRKGISLLDFGGAKSPEKSYFGEEGYFYTPGYAAPELRERGKITEQTDIYAFGCVLFFLVTGRHPREGGRGICPVREQNPYLSFALEKFIGDCTSKDLGHRFFSMEQVMEGLKNLNTGKGVRKRDGIGSFWKGKKQMFQTVKSIILTEQKRENGAMRSFLAGAAVISMATAIMASLSGMAPKDCESLPVNMRNARGGKFLVDTGFEYHTEENPVFEIPIEYFGKGNRYQVTIVQKDMESKRAREHTFVICAD